MAEETGLFPPSRWDVLDLSDKEQAFAYWKTKRDMANWENYLTEARFDKDRPKGKKG